MELHCNECKTDERLCFLQPATFLHSSVTLGNADSQQRVTKGHAPNRELEKRDAEWNIKEWDFTGPFFSAQDPPHQMFSPGCILASANRVWDSHSFVHFRCPKIRKHPLPRLCKWGKF